MTELLYAFGDNSPSLPSTVSVLDEILTDFIIETCHAAALCASYSRRQKIKVDDFRWVLRKNTALLGRVNEHLWRERNIRSQRRIADIDELGKEGVAELAAVAQLGGAQQADMDAAKKGKHRGRKKRKAEEELDGGGRKRLAT